jgi:hypothetical protein
MWNDDDCFGGAQSWGSVNLWTGANRGVKLTSFLFKGLRSIVMCDHIIRRMAVKRDDLLWMHRNSWQRDAGDGWRVTTRCMDRWQRDVWIDDNEMCGVVTADGKWASAPDVGHGPARWMPFMMRFGPRETNNQSDQFMRDWWNHPEGWIKPLARPPAAICPGAQEPRSRRAKWITVLQRSYWSKICGPLRILMHCPVLSCPVLSYPAEVAQLGIVANGANEDIPSGQLWNCTSFACFLILEYFGENSLSESFLVCESPRPRIIEVEPKVCYVLLWITYFL